MWVGWFASGVDLTGGPVGPHDVELRAARPQGKTWRPLTPRAHRRRCDVAAVVGPPGTAVVWCSSAEDLHLLDVRNDRWSDLPPAGAELLYRLMTDVPVHWVPFVPVHDEGSLRAVVLVEAVLPRPDSLGELLTVEPRSSVLQELRGAPVHEEEVPPDGVVVSRRWFLARSADGGRHTWAARAVRTGRGPASSGLEFDVALEEGGVW